MKFRLLAVTASVMAVSAWTVSRPAPVTYVAQMTGAAETPSTNVTGTGTATLVLEGNRLHYTLTVKGLSGPATMAHIHVGKVGVSGPPVFSFPVKHEAAGTLAEGSVDLAKEVSKGVSGDSLKALLADGGAYVNVHTKAHPGGEIRGQVELKR
ncbi:MAG: CHRD domain-containing protein [Gemmatimonadota bacterium]|nr:CHRD domain-containing protein [Gemmatimonadota bacterium]MDE3127142.1 CHRD domain-containing protein [Gemmatimonadota bacterium]MDE3215721.1 CHRD domain-containing protein [Gemmatimonadota bacterium]